jgi:hypothetical protein
VLDHHEAVAGAGAIENRTRRTSNSLPGSWIGTDALDVVSPSTCE